MLSENSMSPIPSRVVVRGLKREFRAPGAWFRHLIGASSTDIKAVDGVDFEIGSGETFSLVGESGCGKSTVARLLCGLYSPSDGHVEFDGTRLASLGGRAQQAPFRRRIQMIFQDPYASLNPRWRVEDIIAEPIRTHRLLNDRKQIRDRVDELLCQVMLAPADGQKFPHEFSGGQRQRISIARAIASNPDFLICDEPTSALDVSVQAQVLNLMKDLQRRHGLTYLFISHNLAVVSHVSDHIGVMYLGRLVEVAPADELFRHPRHPYTKMLIDAIPDLSMSGRQRPAYSGDIPDPMAPPPGCSFHPRCPFANVQCRTQTPKMRKYGSTSVACHAVDDGRLVCGQTQ